MTSHNYYQALSVDGDDDEDDNKRTEEKYPIPTHPPHHGARTPPHEAKEEAARPLYHKQEEKEEEAKQQEEEEEEDIPACRCGALPCRCFRVLTINAEQHLSSLLDEVLFGADVVCIQEVGTLPPGYADQLRLMDYELIHRQGAATAIALRTDWFAKDPPTFTPEHGRYTAVALPTKEGATVVASVYLPTGIEQKSDDSPEVKEAKEVLAAVTQLATAGSVTAAILAGDFNETLTAQDRARDRPVEARSARPGRVLSALTSGDRPFVDAYRALHPTGGFTYSQPLPPGPSGEGGRTHSRIDYIWMRGLAQDDVLFCEVLQLSPPKSHLTKHRPLSATVRRTPTSAAAKRKVRIRINTNKATEAHKQAVANRIESAVQLNAAFIDALLAKPGAEGLSAATDTIIKRAYRAAKSVLGTTRGKPGKSRRLAALQTLATTATEAVAVATNHGPSSIEWLRWLRQAGPDYHPSWEWPTESNLHEWTSAMLETRTEIRRAVNEERRRLSATQTDRRERDPQWAAKLTWEAGAHGRNVLALMDETTQTLITKPNQVKQMLATHYQGVFRTNLPVGALPNPPAPPELPPALARAVRRAVTQPKPGIDPAWWQPLCTDISIGEVRRAASTLHDHASAGPDGVNAGIWKWAVARSTTTAQLVTRLFNAYQRERRTPRVAKISAITPIWKVGKQTTGVKDTRPISLQGALTKLFWKIYALRLKDILARHAILNPAQHAFIRGGSTTKALAEAMGALHAAAENKQTCFLAQFDLAGAFDRVEHSVLRRAMERLHMPAAFVELVSESLVGLRAFVKTAYGDTHPFDVARGVRQGDPLSPLLFIIYADGLHDALACDAVRCQRYPPDKQDQPQPHSIGYADDITGVATSQHEANRQALAVKYGTDLLGGALAVTKCQLLAVQPDRRPPATPPTPIKVGLDEIPLVEQGKHLRTLGLRIDPALTWRSELVRIEGILRKYGNTVRGQHLNPIEAGALYGTFVAPLLAYTLPFVPIRAADAPFWQRCDQVVRNAWADSSRASRYTAGRLPAAVVWSLLQTPRPSKLHAICVAHEAFRQLQQSGTAGNRAARQATYQTASAALHALGLRLEKVNEPPIEAATSLPPAARPATDATHKARNTTVVNYPHLPGRPKTAIKAYQLQLNGARPAAVWLDTAQPIVAAEACPTRALTAIVSASNNHWAFSVRDDAAEHGPPTITTGHERHPPSRYLHLLEAMLRLLLAVPANWPLIIATADLSALQAATGFAYQTEQQQCQAYGRPYLRMMLDIQRARTAPVKMVWLQGLNDEEEEERAGARVDGRRPPVPAHAPPQIQAESLSALIAEWLPAGGHPAAAPFQDGHRPPGWPRTDDIAAWHRETCSTLHDMVIATRHKLRQCEGKSDRKSESKEANTAHLASTDAICRQGSWLRARRSHHPAAAATARNTTVPALAIGPGERRVAVLHGTHPIVGSIRKAGNLLSAQEAERAWSTTARDPAWVDGWMRLTERVWKAAPTTGCASVSRMVLALASRHLATQSHIHKIKPSESSLCAQCSKHETAQHVVFECPAHDRIRQAQLTALRSSLDTDSEEKLIPESETAIARHARLALATLATNRADKDKLAEPPRVDSAVAIDRLWAPLRFTKLRVSAAMFIMTNLLRFGNDKTLDGLHASFKSFEQALQLDSKGALKHEMAQPRLTPVTAAKIMHRLDLRAEYAEHPLQFWPTTAQRHGVIWPLRSAELRNQLIERCGVLPDDAVKSNLHHDPCLVHPVWNDDRQAALIRQADQLIMDGLNSRIILLVPANESPAAARAAANTNTGLSVRITLDTVALAPKASASASKTPFTLLWLDAAHQTDRPARLRVTHGALLRSLQAELPGPATAAITTRRWFNESSFANYLRRVFDHDEPDEPQSIRLPRNLLRLAAGAFASAEERTLRDMLEERASVANISITMLQHVDKCWKERAAHQPLALLPAPEGD